MVIGVHSPEFAFEKRPANVRKPIADLQVQYPVAVDNNYIWRAFENQYCRRTISSTRLAASVTIISAKAATTNRRR